MENKENRTLKVDQYRQIAASIEQQLARYMVGQKILVHDLLVTLLAGGNALLEGVPGLGKTMLIQTLSEVLACTFNRIQFTPDLMPADILGTTIITSLEDGHRSLPTWCWRMRSTGLRRAHNLRCWRRCRKAG